ncbi:hypothetical protein [Lactococcus garvieae]|uniref:hypothetical protein n=1 Tax=Lactococcus garvieae TaxID=1363 RepID=UPI00398E6A79
MKKVKVFLIIFLLTVFNGPIKIIRADSTFFSSQVNYDVNQTVIEAPKINTVYDGDTSLTGILPNKGITYYHSNHRLYSCGMANIKW